MKKIEKKLIQLEPVVKIAAIGNGWLVEYPHPNEDCNLQESVVRDLVMDDVLCDCRALQQLLFMIKEGLGEYYSKHNKYNVCIVIKETETGKEIE